MKKKKGLLKFFRNLCGRFRKFPEVDVDSRQFSDVRLFRVISLRLCILWIRTQDALITRRRGHSFTSENTVFPLYKNDYVSDCNDFAFNEISTFFHRLLIFQFVMSASLFCYGARGGGKEKSFSPLLPLTVTRVWQWIQTNFFKKKKKNRDYIIGKLTKGCLGNAKKDYIEYTK